MVQRKKADEIKFTPDQFKGIVVSLSLRCHSMLPQGVRNSVDVSDLIQEGMMFLYRVLSRTGGRKATFVPKKAQASTWVYSLLMNFYRGWHEMHVVARKRKVELVELDNSPVAYNAHAASSTYSDVMDALRKVESLHRAASLDLVEYLDINLFQHPDKVAKARGRRFQVMAAEFRKLAKQHNVTISDYRTVMRVCARQEAASS